MRRDMDVEVAAMILEPVVGHADQREAEMNAPTAMPAAVNLPNGASVSFVVMLKSPKSPDANNNTNHSHYYCC
jgi:hypothetical protein